MPVRALFASPSPPNGDRIVCGTADGQMLFLTMRDMGEKAEI